ncbi:hypothetical protein KRX51_03850 [Corynebacterium sp. TAE3-ERU12]|uniref:hypothetical protein n=1 Tax=Corynebacterium sp. TAE3-ERU12 TaxID=2849491 RepID=UPI001C44EF9C|nr:hypothetical protein [Corynebacterium sp. TAE3-ERU12]MBV7295051.1 hypothetical protein [Corynebacterium sp. TAE3-ERU12]
MRRPTELPTPVTAAISMVGTVAPVVPLAVVALVADVLWLRWGWLALTAALILALVLAVVEIIAMVAVRHWPVVVGLTVVALVATLLTTDAWIPILLVGGAAAGAVAGAIARVQYNAAERRRQHRLAALPNWAADELGDARRELDPTYIRQGDQLVIGSHSDAAVTCLSAICRALPGATVVAGVPAIAVHGSRVAVLVCPGTDPQPVPQLPDGAHIKVFLLDTGVVELPATDATVVTPEGCQPLVAHLIAGAPPNGDALHGLAAHLHDRITWALTQNPR